MKKHHWLYGIAFVSGMAVWILVCSYSGRREAWDSGLYFTVGIPVICLVAGVLGYVEPERPWRWGITPLIGQAVWMLVSQGVGNLLPLGLVVFGVFSTPSILTAIVGAAIVKRNG